MNNKALEVFNAEANAEARSVLLDRMCEICSLLDKAQSATTKESFLLLLRSVEIEVRARRTSLNNARYGSSNSLSKENRGKLKLQEAIKAIGEPVLIIPKKKEEPQSLELTLEDEKDNLAERKEKRFLDLWELYPHSRRNLKKQIRTKFVHMSEELQEKIISHIKQMKDTEQWQNEQYVPNISTYFNQQRWEAEPLQTNCCAQSTVKNRVVNNIDNQVVERSSFTFNEL